MKGRAISLVASAAIAAGCMSLVMQSEWSGAAPPAQSPYPSGVFVSLGERDAWLAVRNDSARVSIAFTTTDPGLQDRILNQGIFVWFDPGGGESRAFGIRYPVAWSGSPTGLDAVPGQPGSVEGPGAGRPGDDLEVYSDAFRQHDRYAKADVPGLEVQVRRRADTLIYLLTVPLRGHGHDSYALDAAPGEVAGIGIETRDTRTTGESAGSILPFIVWRNVRLAARP